MARVDPYKNYRFLLEIDSITQAGFAECSSAGSEVAVVEQSVGFDAGLLSHVEVAVAKLEGRTEAHAVVPEGDDGNGHVATALTRYRR